MAVVPKVNVKFTLNFPFVAVSWLLGAAAAGIVHWALLTCSSCFIVQAIYTIIVYKLNFVYVTFGERENCTVEIFILHECCV